MTNSSCIGKGLEATSGGSYLQRSRSYLALAGSLLGAAIAVGLFDHVEPGGVAWLRSLFAAMILVAIARPWRRSWSRVDLGWTAAFGTVLVSMNACFYAAADVLPLGTAVAIEFIGPVAFAALATRTARNWAAIALAGLA